MKVIYETEKEEPTFDQVWIDQFFVNCNGALCQKSTGSRYNTIADKDGIPCGDVFENVDKDEAIKRVLPKVRKIEF